MLDNNSDETVHLCHIHHSPNLNSTLLMVIELKHYGNHAEALRVAVLRKVL